MNPSIMALYPLEGVKDGQDAGPYDGMEECR